MKKNMLLIMLVLIGLYTDYANCFTLTVTNSENSSQTGSFPAEGTDTLGNIKARIRRVFRLSSETMNLYRNNNALSSNNTNTLAEEGITANATIEFAEMTVANPFSEDEQQQSQTIISSSPTTSQETKETKEQTELPKTTVTEEMYKKTTSEPYSNDISKDL